MAKPRPSIYQETVELKERATWFSRGSHVLREDKLGRNIALRHWGAGFYVYDKAENARFMRAIQWYNLALSLLLSPLLAFGLPDGYELITVLFVIPAFTVLDMYLFPLVFKRGFPDLRRVFYAQPSA